MPYPPNIAPQTPSDPYDVVGIGNDPAFVFLKGSVFETIVGAKSRCRIDLPFYDGSTTRDVVDASTLGRGPLSVINIPLGTGQLISLPGDVAYTDNVTALPIADEIATMMMQDDNFTHTPPHQNIFGTTVIRYFDGPVTANLPTGDVVGEFPVDQWRGEGSKIPQIIGATPPIYDPNATE